MFDPVSAVAAGAAVVSAGVGLWGAFQGGPDQGSAPPPSNYYEYDTDGNLVREQVWDAAKQGYVSRTYKTAEEKADAAAKKELRNQFMSYLNQTPEDRVKAYDEYAANFSAQMHKDVDKQYEKTYSSAEENMNKRGLVGSRAYVDTMNELRSEKLETDTDIAQKAALAKETLASNDRSFWLQGVNALDSGIRADQALALNQTHTAANIANQGTAATLGAYAANSNNNVLKWQAQQNQSSNLINTSAGLAFLYGLNKGGARTNNTRSIQGVVDSGGTGINLFQ